MTCVRWYESAFRGWRVLVAVYAVLILISHLYQSVFRAGAKLDPGQNRIQLRESGNGADPHRMISVSYRHSNAGRDASAAPILLLHGSPVGVPMFRHMLPTLEQMHEVVSPDLPGFDGSTRDISDYSVRAHALYMAQFLDSLGIERVHLVGYSMGGGVALHVNEIAPHHVASITLLSSIGVQELELLGGYHVNHAIHGVQLGILWLIENLLPHFGLLHRFPINVPYARNFYDTDQRPLRAILQRFDAPMLILHGESDRLVVPEVAREHFRLVPQSEIIWYQGGHGIVMSKGAEIARDIKRFVDRVQGGTAARRQDASGERGVLAARPFDSSSVREAEGIALFVLMLLVAVATLVSEDLACIGAGLAAAKGLMGFVPATLAALSGIVIGDMLLYFAGRWGGRRLLKYPPICWLVKESDLEASRHWFETRGPAIILITRFMPGTRLPTYVAAGVIRASFWMFTLYFLLAALLWTPLLVGLSALIGQPLIDYFLEYRFWAIPALLAFILLIRLASRLVMAIFSFRARRLLLSDFRRATRWEFWPPCLFYLPLVIYVLFLGLRHRHLTLFTAANPAIPAGGFVGESKSEILDGLRSAGDFIARYRKIHGTLRGREQLEHVRHFMQTFALDFPLVIKPDIGERGKNVRIVHNNSEAEAALAAIDGDAIAQEHVPGREFGVFYFRHPGEETGKLFSVTDKRLLKLTGDGQRTLEELILADERAMCMARFHFREHRGQLHYQPAKGEVIDLVQVGTHCKGALFLDGQSVATPELARKIDEISRGMDGFYFGRYDIRARSETDLANGRNFKIIELNGVTSEATHIYDPKTRLFSAYRVLMRQWRHAFEIGRANRDRGAKTLPVRRLIAMWART